MSNKNDKKSKAEHLMDSVFDQELMKKIIFEYATKRNLDSFKDSPEKEIFLNSIKNLKYTEKPMSDEEVTEYESQLEKAVDYVERSKIILHMLDNYTEFPERMKKTLREKYGNLLVTLRRKNKEV